MATFNCWTALGTSRIPVSFKLPRGAVVWESEQPFRIDSLFQPITDGFSKPLFTSRRGRKGLSDTATQILLTSLRLFEVLKCGSLRHGLSTVHSGRHMALAFAQSRNSGGNLKPTVHPTPQGAPSTSHNNGNHNGIPRLRDRLCLLIRQHRLDANLVKAYATDSCGTPNLRDATREQIESFITNLRDWATRDRPALLCKLNSYSRPQEPIS